ncbi:hypothetical protein GIB67_038279 [Kingdonia uniflora]|uniref:Uncharacterized protein n=1 Tax=Kingdonia uniflora TaxID=39325 RepID=A0A7J7MSB9_9MAGN|nr:hypothetical protein GIB67_038279 [Kingdonia uniflora]
MSESIIAKENNTTSSSPERDTVPLHQTGSPTKSAVSGSHTGLKLTSRWDRNLLPASMFDKTFESDQEGVMQRMFRNK